MESKELKVIDPSILDKVIKSVTLIATCAYEVYQIWKVNK